MYILKLYNYIGCIFSSCFFQKARIGHRNCANLEKCATLVCKVTVFSAVDRSADAVLMTAVNGGQRPQMTNEWNSCFPDLF